MTEDECIADKKDEGTLNDQGIEHSFARSPFFRKDYATKVIVHPTEYDVRISFLNEKFKEHPNNEIFLIDSMIMLTPIAAKELLNQLQIVIAQWEKKNPIPPRSDKTVYAKFEAE